MRPLRWTLAWVTLVALVIFLASCGGPRALRPLYNYGSIGVAFSPDGSALAIVYESDLKGMQLDLRDWPSLKRRWRVKVEEGYGSIMNPVAFSPDGEELALVTRDHLLRYSIGGELIKEIPIRGDPRIVADDILLTVSYVPDGGLAVLVDRDDFPFLARYDREGKPSGDLIPVGDEEWIGWSRPFSADGRFLAYVESFHIVGLLDLVTEEAKEWDLKDKLGVKPSGGLLRAVWGVAVHPQGREIALGLHVDEPGLPRVVRLDARTGEIIEEFLPSEREDDYICALVYSRDGSLLAALACDFSEAALVVRPLPDGDLRVICEGEPGKDCPGRPIVFSPDGRYLALQRSDRVTFMDVSERKQK